MWCINEIPELWIFINEGCSNSSITCVPELLTKPLAAFGSVQSYCTMVSQDIWKEIPKAYCMVTSLSVTCSKYEYANYLIQLIEMLLHAINDFEIIVEFCSQLIEFLRGFHNKSIERSHAAILTSEGITQTRTSLCFVMSSSRWRMWHYILFFKGLAVGNNRPGIVLI